MFADMNENLSPLLDASITNAGLTSTPALLADPLFQESNLMRSES